jgi:hypothetical protein
MGAWAGLVICSPELSRNGGRRRWFYVRRAQRRWAGPAAGGRGYGGWLRPGMGGTTAAACNMHKGAVTPRTRALVCEHERYVQVGCPDWAFIGSDGIQLAELQTNRTKAGLLAYCVVRSNGPLLLDIRIKLLFSPSRGYNTNKITTYFILLAFSQKKRLIS